MAWNILLVIETTLWLLWDVNKFIRLDGFFKMFSNEQEKSQDKL